MQCLFFWEFILFHFFSLPPLQLEHHRGEGRRRKKIKSKDFCVVVVGGRTVEQSIDDDESKKKKAIIKVFDMLIATFQLFNTNISNTVTLNKRTHRIS